MNPQTNELIDLTNLQDVIKASILEHDGFIPLPKTLQSEAKQALDNKESVIIPDDNSRLAKWARKIRHNQEIGKIKNII